MAWFYVDDGFPDCAKLADIPEHLLTAAVGLWTLAGAWSRRKLTGGFVPAGQVRRLGGTSAEADALVTAGLWEASEKGYQFHDWQEWQETPEDLESKREKNRSRQQAWRRKKDGVTGQSRARNGVTPPLRDDSSRVSNGHVRGDPSPSPSPDPNALATLAHSSRARAFVEPLSVEQPPPAAELEHGEPDSTHEDREPFGVFVRREFGERFDRATATPPIWTDDNRRLIEQLAGWLESTQGGDPRAACVRLLDAFFADNWVRDNGFPLRNLVNRASRYLGGTNNAKALKARAHEALMAGRHEEFRKLTAQARELEGKRHAG
jgi:hypothetical protein